MTRRLSPARASARGTIASLSYAVAAGKRQPDDPDLRNAKRELDVIRVEDRLGDLADEAQKVVANWPDLTAEQLGRIAGVLKAAGVNG